MSSYPSRRYHERVARESGYPPGPLERVFRLADFMARIDIVAVVAMPHGVVPAIITAIGKARKKRRGVPAVRIRCPLKTCAIFGLRGESPQSRIDPWTWADAVRLCERQPAIEPSRSA